MSKTEITLDEYRKALKEMGYQVRTKRNSDFVTATVTHKETGDKVTGFNVMSPEFREKHLAFFEYRQTVSVRESGPYGMRVV